jgi:hypothetical protein
MHGKPMLIWGFSFLLIGHIVAVGQDVLGRQSVKPVITSVAANMTHEEAMVRTAYAKFAYASEQEVIGHLALEADGAPLPKEYSGLTSDQRLADAQVTFALSDFEIGNLSDIINRKAITLIAPPIGEMLMADTPVYGYGGDSNGIGLNWYSVKPHWQQASATSPEVLNATLGELYEIEWKAQPSPIQWQRYASYSVTVTFQGKSRGPYKALFVFGHDTKGNEMLVPEDGTIDSIALATALSVHLFPDPFVRSRLRTFPVVANWLNAKQKSGSACSVGQRDVCCDLIQLQCGPGSRDVTEWLAKPLPIQAR